VTGYTETNEPKRLAIPRHTDRHRHIQTDTQTHRDRHTERQ